MRGLKKGLKHSECRYWVRSVELSASGSNRFYSSIRVDKEAVWPLK
jgi:hypothetical protein